MSHSRDLNLPFVLDDDHILSMFRKASHLADPEDAIDVDSFITVLLHDRDIAVALASAPRRDEEAHSANSAYSKAVAQLDNQPMVWMPPGGDGSAGSMAAGRGAMQISRTDNSLAVKQLVQVWEEIYSVQVPQILDELEEVAVPVEEDVKVDPSKAARSRTVTTRDVANLRSQTDKVSQLIGDAQTMMTKPALGTAWTALRRLLARVHKAKAKAGIDPRW